MREHDRPPAFTRPVLVVLAVTVAALLVAAGVAVTRGNHEFIFYVFVLAGIGSVIGAIHHRIGLSLGVLWAMCLWAIVHMLGGLVPVPDSWPINGEQRVLYSLWLVPDRLKFDHIVHAFGFGATTWLCWEGLVACTRAMVTDRVAAVRPTLGRLTLAGAAGLGFGALNEIVEFFATLLVPDTNVGGYVNTGWDLVSNLVGVVIAAILIRLTWRAD